ncbi:MAG TPA: Ni/Fe hydrogenase subunit alpha [Bacillota bacterium]|nr:Ni/Fe hydrogenase subunit alpha [Bacillota bacterium]
MSKKIDINVKHVTRIEGHGNIVVKASDGTIEKVEWQVPEAPRFFEAMMRGLSWQDIQTVVSRVCGICSISHSLAAVKGIEAAMGLEVSEQTEKLRLLTHYSEYLQSHVLHIGYLVAPDLLGAKSVVPLVETHFDVVKTVIKLHRIANNWSDLMVGRTTHPVTIKPGGFSKLPTATELKELRNILTSIIPDIKGVAGVVLSLADKIPAFERETEYISLVNPGSYTFYAGEIGSSDTSETVSVQQFESVVNEYVSPQSTAKWTRWHRDAYAVGALARYNHNSRYLLPMAAETAKTFGLGERCINPYMNTIAQLVEVVQIVEQSLSLIDELLTAGIKAESPAQKPNAGTGAGCVEAPRGILFHRYSFDDKGICTGANICIPTNQNHANIQKDFEALVPQILDKSQDEIRLLLEMLVRAYDPCVSCSTHYLDVKFI